MEFTTQGNVPYKRDNPVTVVTFINDLTMWGQGAVCIREFEEFSNCVQMIQSNADMCQA